jgi:hypothetical protein
MAERETGVGQLCGGLGQMVLPIWAGAEESTHKDFSKMNFPF